MRAINSLTIFFLFVSTFLFGLSDDLAQLEKRAIAENNPVLFNQLANELLKSEQFSLAKKNAEKGLSIAVEIQNIKARAKANEILGEVSEQRFDYTNATVYFLSALSDWKNLKNEEGIAKINHHIGCIFYFQKEYINALFHLNRAKELYEKLGTEKKMAKVYKNLGDVFYQQKFYGKAKSSYMTAFDLFIKKEDFKKAAAIARFLGKITLDLGDEEGALVYFSQSLDLHGSLEDLPNIATDYNDLALTYLAQKSYEEAEENNAIAYDIRVELKDTIGMAESLKNFGLIFINLKGKEKATAYLKKSAQLLNRVEVVSTTPTIYKAISNSFAILEDFPLAYKYETQFAQSQQTLFNKDKTTALSELTTRYESESEAEEQRQEITLLEKEKAANLWLRSFLLAVIGLIVTLLVALFYHFQIKKKDNLVLKEKNSEILWQKEEIDRKNMQLEEKAASLDLLNNKLVGEMAERESIERSSFARDSFLAMMSHEMRTPINIIVGLSHLLLEDNPREDQKESLRNLQFSANNLVVFINDVLDYSKIEAGKIVIQNREFQLNQVVKDVDKWSHLQAEEKEVQLEYNIEKSVPEVLIGDPTRLNQILTNLISNSLSNTENGVIKVNISLHQLNEKNITLEVDITDNGRGIEKAKLKEMFRKFTRDPEMDMYGGVNTSGLELAITKRLVDLQNGRIEANSILGEGTVFKVFLPYTIPTKLSAPEKLEDKQLLSYHYLVGKKILVVEDNKINQLVVRKMLQKLGVLVTTANNGLESLDCIQDTYFDLILMDIQMPKMDGYRATAEIRKSSDPKIANVPIIALTASAYLTKKEKAQLFGMDDHVGKPFGPEELMEKISSCLARKERDVNVKIS